MPCLGRKLRYFIIVGNFSIRYAIIIYAIIGTKKARAHV